MDNMQAATEAVDLARVRVMDLRIELAQRRDDLLTGAELMVKLDVCAEFGR